MSKRRVLVTGGLGFLGHHLVEHLHKETDWDIVVLDKMTYASSGMDRLRDVKVSRQIAWKGHGSMSDVYETAPLLSSPRVQVLGCDLAQEIPEGISKEIGDVDYVIHAGAETHVDHSITDPLPFLRSNVIGTHHLLWWARSRASPLGRLGRLSRILLVSTDEVYGPASWESTGNLEADPFRPANPYAASKAGAEALAMAYANTYKMPITIVNTMNLVGERQHWEKFVPLVIRGCLTGQKILIHADPTCTRSGSRFYIHARNYSSALLWILREGLTDLKLHVAGEREMSNLELAQMISGIVRKPLNHELVDFHSSRPGHDLRYALNDSHIRSMGWTQPVDFEKSIERTVRWYLANPTWLGLLANPTWLGLPPQ